MTVKPAAVSALATRPASLTGVVSFADLYSSLPITSAKRISSAWPASGPDASARNKASNQDNVIRRDAAAGENLLIALPESAFA